MGRVKKRQTMMKFRERNEIESIKKNNNGLVSIPLLDVAPAPFLVFRRYEKFSISDFPSRAEDQKD